MNISEAGKMAGISALSFTENSDTAVTEKSVSTFGTDIVEEENINFKNNPFNIFGKNIENFQKFKNKDRYDALNATNKTCTNVNNMYKDFKKSYPDIEVEFEAPPNPADYGKRREGFQSYMQELERWENNCKAAIDEAVREQNSLKKENPAKKTDDGVPKEVPQQPDFPKKSAPPAKTTPPKAKKSPKPAEPSEPSAPAPPSKGYGYSKGPVDPGYNVDPGYYANPVPVKSNDDDANRLLREALLKGRESSEPKRPSYLRPIANSPGIYEDERTGKLVRWGKSPISDK